MLLIDELKSLERGKIYCMSVNMKKRGIKENVKHFLEITRKLGLTFIVISDEMKIVSLPDGMENPSSLTRKDS